MSDQHRRARATSPPSTPGPDRSSAPSGAATGARPCRAGSAERAGTDLADTEAWARLAPALPHPPPRRRAQRRPARRPQEGLRRRAGRRGRAPVGEPRGAGAAAAPALAATRATASSAAATAPPSRASSARSASPPTAIFGPQTRRAPERFQRAHGLVVDGIAGPATWAALRGARPALARTARVAAAGARHLGGGAAAGSSARSASRRRHLRPADRARRARLPALHGLTVDGIAGPRTFAALRGSAARGAQLASFSLGGERRGGSVSRLQHLLGIPADGVFGPQTHRAVIRFQLHHGLAPTASSARRPGARSACARRTRCTCAAAGAPRTPGRRARASSRGSSPRATRSPPAPTSRAAGTARSSPRGYDCSGSVSYALHGGGLLRRPRTPPQLESYGAARPRPAHHDLRQRRPRLHGRGRPPLRHLGDVARPADRAGPATMRSLARATSSATRPATRPAARGAA